MVQLTPYELHATIATMQRYGGRFFKNLAGALVAADPTNRMRLLQAFPEIVVDYGPDSSLYNSFITTCRPQPASDTKAQSTT